MAGIADQPFRLTVKRAGVSLIFTELISAEGLVRNSRKTFDLMRFSPLERPIGIQLFGSRPESMAEAARIAESLEPDLIDLNFGCPARKVVNGGSGSAILRDTDLLRHIVRDVVRAVHTPVSCKIRTGWDAAHPVAEEAARIIEGEGASLLTLHPRTREQGFSGRADWSVIARVRACTGIPLIGNGDIITPEDAKRMLSETGCDAVMVGRGAMGRPWIFRMIDATLQSGCPVPEPPVGERIGFCLEHYDRALEILGARRGVREMRKHIGWYLKGLSYVSRLRSRLMIMEDPEEVKKNLREFSQTYDGQIAEEQDHGDSGASPQF